MATDSDSRGPRPGLAALAFLGAALAAGLAWKVWNDSQQAARAPSMPPPARAPAPPPGPPPVPYGQVVTAPRPVPAPAVDLPTASGQRFNLASARGQVVVVNFWATWCPPCAKEMPSMVALGEALSRKYPGKFRMVAVSVDEEPDAVKQFFAKPPYQGPPKGVTVAFEPGAGDVTRGFYCKGRGACGPSDVKFPETYFVDREGRIVAFVVGDIDWSTQAPQAFLEDLIRG